MTEYVIVDQSQLSGLSWIEGKEAAIADQRKRIASLEKRLSENAQNQHNAKRMRNANLWRYRYLKSASDLRHIVDRSIAWRPGAVCIAGALLGGIALSISGSWLAGLISAAIASAVVGKMLFSLTDSEINSAGQLVSTALFNAEADYHSACELNKNLSADLLKTKDECDRSMRDLQDLKKSDHSMVTLRALARSDWKSLRSEEFETFLETVFRELGYNVQMTKVTGDQGVDLILGYRGNRIAVQAKGYYNSVSNSAVQEAHSGCAYYKCDYSAVITNSRFSRSAVELAETIGCVLVDENLLPMLILKQQDLWQLCCDRKD